MTNKELFVEAHRLTRGVKARHPEVDYRTQFGLFVSVMKKMHKEGATLWFDIEKVGLKIALEYDGYCKFTVNNWTKGNNDRSYIKIVKYVNNKRVERDCGYWDNLYFKYIPARYNIFDLV